MFDTNRKQIHEQIRLMVEPKFLNMFYSTDHRINTLNLELFYWSSSGYVSISIIGTSILMSEDCRIYYFLQSGASFNAERNPVE
jgi:hypothetical protein